jgi:hypothetical protein
MGVVLPSSCVKSKRQSYRLGLSAARLFHTKGVIEAIPDMALKLAGIKSALKPEAGEKKGTKEAE